MERPGVINSAVTVVTIENNVQKVPTAWAEEAMEAVMKGIVVTSINTDPLIRAQARDYEQRLRQYIFNTLHPFFRRAITAERMRSE